VVKEGTWARKDAYFNPGDGEKQPIVIPPRKSASHTFQKGHFLAERGTSFFEKQEEGDLCCKREVGTSQKGSVKGKTVNSVSSRGRLLGHCW